MAEIINLRAAKKAKARSQARAQGDANAARHGQTKAEKALVQARTDKAKRDLDGAKRE